MAQRRLSAVCSVTKGGAVPSWPRPPQPARLLLSPKLLKSALSFCSVMCYIFVVDCFLFDRVTQSCMFCLNYFNSFGGVQSTTWVSHTLGLVRAPPMISTQFMGPSITLPKTRESLRSRDYQRDKHVEKQRSRDRSLASARGRSRICGSNSIRIYISVPR